jgi:uncharacterized lipoprotein YmbA
MFSYYKILPLVILSVYFLGCGGSKPSRYYILSEMASPPKIVADKSGLQIGIGPVRFPEHLRRPQIGSFIGRNQLKFAEYDRWAEPLDENFLRVLSENLSELLQTDKVYTYPFIGAPQFDYQLILDVREFVMKQQDAVILSVQWQIIKTDDQELLSTQRATYRQPVNPEDYSSIVEGMSQTIENFSRDIAEILGKVN